MAVCLQCDQKIGMFKRAIEGVYCSYGCRDAARAARREAEERHSQAVVTQQTLEPQPEAPRMQSQVVAKGPVPAYTECPKCSSEWSYEAGAGALGLHHGECNRCGYRADFLTIDVCPNCRCRSLVGQTDEARCPRCKTRVRQVQTA